MMVRVPEPPAGRVRAAGDTEAVKIVTLSWAASMAAAALTPAGGAGSQGGVAVMVAVPVLTIVGEKVVEELPAGMVTVGGTVTTEGLED